MIPVSGIDAPFWRKLVDGAAAMDVSPISLALVMFMESGLHPTASNKGYALGLNQLSTESGTYQGITGNMPPSQYLSLPASVQLDYVLKFYRGQLAQHPQATSARDLYWLNYRPATYVPDAPDDYVIIASDPNNPALTDADGAVRAGSLARALDRAAAGNPTRWNAIVQNIQELAPGASLSGSSSKSVFAGGLVGVAVGSLAALYLTRPRAFAPLLRWRRA